jgi:hypothetical protein
MTVPPPTGQTPAPALSAFLRGIERRGAVFAELLVGSPVLGDDALRVAMRSFRQVAARTPFGDWPRRFWALLLAAPPLRAVPATPAWPPPFALFRDLGMGPRAALLLRVAAGLGEADAAAVLGVARPTYRLALQRALPRLADGGPDVAAWHALGDAARAAIRALPPDRLGHLAQGREEALQQRAAPRPAIRQPEGPRRWRLPALAAVVLSTLGALAWTFLAVPPPVDPDMPISTEPLPPAEAPAATYGADVALLGHPDLDLLLEASSEPAAAEPGFHAWHATRLAQEDGDAELPPVAEGVAADVASTQGVDDATP